MFRSVLFEDEVGRVYGPYTKMSTSYDLINYKTPNMAGPTPQIFLDQKYFSSSSNRKQERRRWKYQIEWFGHTGDPVKSVIMITSRNNYDGLETAGVRDSSTRGVTVSSWVSTRQWSGSQFQYLQLFAKLTISGNAVRNASVSVGVEIETKNGTFLGMSPRLMSDNGQGDDDVIEGNH